jgi:chromosome segregation ATPase
LDEAGRIAMDGTEFGGVGLAAGIVLKSSVDWVRERWKGRNDAKKLDIQHDQQAAENDARAVPAYQDLVATLMASQQALSVKLDTVEAGYTAKLDNLQRSYNEQAIKLGILEHQMVDMTSKLADAHQQKALDVATIGHLNSEVDRLCDDLDDVRANLIAMRRDRDKYRDLFHQCAEGSLSLPFIDPGPLVLDGEEIDATQTNRLLGVKGPI